MRIRRFALATPRRRAARRISLAMGARALRRDGLMHLSKTAAFVACLIAIAFAAASLAPPASAHDPNHVYFDESGSPCWVHSDDPFGFHWVLADTSSSVCRTTFASDAEWIYSFNAETGAYQRSANGLVCTAAGGCDDYAPPAFQHPDCDQLTDDDWVAWWTP